MPGALFGDELKLEFDHQFFCWWKAVVLLVREWNGWNDRGGVVREVLL